MNLSVNRAGFKSQWCYKQFCLTFFHRNHRILYDLCAERGMNLNNDNRDRDRNDNRREDRDRRRQQMDGFPGFPQRPGMEEPRGFGTPPGLQPGFPGMEGQPRTAPPNFIPEAPDMGRRQMGSPGQDQFGLQRFPQPVRPRELRRCQNRFTYIWLVNGNAFWFFPTFVGSQFVQGFRWRRNRWEFDRINLRRILFFRCF